MKENLTSRKFLITLSLIIVAAAVDILAKNGLSENLKEVIIYLGAVFMGGNSIEHISKTIKTKFEGSSSPEQAPTTVVQENSEISAKLQQLEEANGIMTATISQLQDTVKKVIDMISKKY